MFLTSSIATWIKWQEKKPFCYILIYAELFLKKVVVSFWNECQLEAYSVLVYYIDVWVSS